jgi:hypothetical protein
MTNQTPTLIMTEDYQGADISAEDEIPLSLFKLFIELFIINR